MLELITIINKKINPGRKMIFPVVNDLAIHQNKNEEPNELLNTITMVTGVATLFFALGLWFGRRGFNTASLSSERILTHSSEQPLEDPEKKTPVREAVIDSSENASKLLLSTPPEDLEKANEEPSHDDFMKIYHTSWPDFDWYDKEIHDKARELFSKSTNLCKLLQSKDENGHTLFSKISDNSPMLVAILSSLDLHLPKADQLVKAKGDQVKSVLNEFPVTSCLLKQLPITILSLTSSQQQHYSFLKGGIKNLRATLYVLETLFPKHSIEALSEFNVSIPCYRSEVIFTLLLWALQALDEKPDVIREAFGTLYSEVTSIYSKALSDRLAFLTKMNSSLRDEEEDHGFFLVISLFDDSEIGHIRHRIGLYDKLEKSTGFQDVFRRILSGNMFRENMPSKFFWKTLIKDVSNLNQKHILTKNDLRALKKYIKIVFFSVMNNPLSEIPEEAILELEKSTSFKKHFVERVEKYKDRILHVQVTKLFWKYFTKYVDQNGPLAKQLSPPAL